MKIHNPRAIFLHQGGELYGSDKVFYQIIKRATRYVNPIVILSEDGPLRLKLATLTKDIFIYELGTFRRKYCNLFGILRCSYYILCATWKLLKIVRKEHPKFIYTNTIGILPGGIVAKILKIPHLWHIHEIIVKPIWLLYFFQKVLLMLANIVIANSNATKNHLTMNNQKLNNRSLVIYNGLDYEEFDQKQNSEGTKGEFGVLENEILVGLIGRISYLKGQEYLLEAAKTIKNQGYTLKYAIVGDVYKGNESLIDKLRDKIYEYNLQNDIFLCGFREDIQSLIRTVDIIVIPSILPESFGMVSLEAMAASKPVVATSLGGSLEIIEDGVTGFLVPPDNSELLAERIVKLAQDKSLRERMGKSGRTRLEEKFTIKQFEENLDALFVKVLPQIKNLFIKGN